MDLSIESSAHNNRFVGFGCVFVIRVGLSVSSEL